MPAALLSRRWLGFTALVLTLVAAFVLLGRWQLHRGEARHDRNAAVRSNLAAAPVPAETVLAADHGVARTDVWRRVTATGHYDSAHAMVVRNRTLEGSPGFQVLVPLQVATGPAVLVDRGWVPVGESSRDLPVVPVAPEGLVAVVGHVRASEAAHRGAAPPAGQLAAIDVPGVARTLPYPLLDGYLELAQETPRPGSAPRLLPTPELGAGPHFFYALQWWTFAVIAVVGYVVLGRRELADAAVQQVPHVQPSRTA